LNTQNTGTITYNKLVFDPLKAATLFINRASTNILMTMNSAYTASNVAGTTGLLYGLDFDRNGKFFAVGGSTKTLYIYNATTFAFDSLWNTTD
jgi:hypothetical protein